MTNDNKSLAHTRWNCKYHIKVLPYHNFAGSKYSALGMKNTLPTELPAEDALRIAEQKLSLV